MTILPCPCFPPFSLHVCLPACPLACLPACLPSNPRDLATNRDTGFCARQRDPGPHPRQVTISVDVEKYWGLPVPFRPRGQRVGPLEATHSAVSQRAQERFWHGSFHRERKGCYASSPCCSRGIILTALFASSLRTCLLWACPAIRVDAEVEFFSLRVAPRVSTSCYRACHPPGGVVV